MSTVSSLDEESINGNILIKKISEFSYAPSLNDIVGFSVSNMIEKKNSLISNNNHTAIGIIVKINGSFANSTVVILLNGLYKTPSYNSFANGTELFLGNNGNLVSSIETNTNYIKKIATKTPDGLFINIQQTEEYVNL